MGGLNYEKRRIFISLYTTIAGSNTRDSLYMKKEFQDNDLDFMRIVFVNKDLETIYIGKSYTKEIYDIIKNNDVNKDMAEIIRDYLKIFIQKPCKCEAFGV